MKKQNFLRMLLAVSFLGSCGKTGNVNDLYKFPGSLGLTSDIRVEVNIDFKTDPGEGAIDFQNKSFLLNAFSLDGGDVQVAIRTLDGSPVNDLPVTLSSSHTTFDAIVSMPINITPGADGYALRFNLKEASTALTADENGTKLDAIRGSVQSGTAAATNDVDLSLASTIAYQFLKENSDTLLSSKVFTSYGDLISLITEQQVAVEAQVDNSLSHSVASYVAAISAAIQNQILTNKTLQSSIAEKLLNSIDTGTTDEEKAAIAQKFAQTFTAQLKSIASSIQETLGDTSSSPSKVFNTGYIQPENLPKPESYSDTIFAPSAVAFTDTDGTTAVGGSVLITAPVVKTGIVSYNVYLGGSTKAESQLKLLGNVAASASPLALVIESGTVLSEENGYFWVYPVADGKQLDAPTSLQIVNVIDAPAAPNLANNSTHTFAMTEFAGATRNMVNTGGTNLTSCTLSLQPTFASNPFTVAVSTDKKTCVITLSNDYPHSITIHAIIVATNAVGSSTVNATLIRQMVDEPDLANTDIVFAPTAALNSTVEIVNNGGGSLTSCTMEEALGWSGGPVFDISISTDKSTCVIKLVDTTQAPYTSTFVVTAVNPGGSNVTMITMKHESALLVPVIVSETIEMYGTPMSPDVVPLTNTGGGQLTDCSMTPSSSDFSIQISGNDPDTCEIVDASDSCNLDTYTFAVTATNAAGSSVVSNVTVNHNGSCFH